MSSGEPAETTNLVPVSNHREERELFPVSAARR